MEKKKTIPELISYPYPYRPEDNLLTFLDVADDNFIEDICQYLDEIGDYASLVTWSRQNKRLRRLWQAFLDLEKERRRLESLEWIGLSVKTKEGTFALLDLLWRHLADDIDPKYLDQLVFPRKQPYLVRIHFRAHHYIEITLQGPVILRDLYSLCHRYVLEHSDLLEGITNSYLLQAYHDVSMYDIFIMSYRDHQDHHLDQTFRVHAMDHSRDEY